MPRDPSNFSADFRKRVEETRAQREQVRTLVADKRWREAEPVAARAVAYATRAASLQLSRAGAESLIGDTNDLMPAWFLVAGASARRAVAFVEVLAAHHSGTGSGF